MATSSFPITYSQTVPSGRGPNALIEGMPSTGQEMIARAVQGAGETLYSIAMKKKEENERELEKEHRMMMFSQTQKAKFQIDEYNIKYKQLIQAENDPIKISNLKEEWRKGLGDLTSRLQETTYFPEVKEDIAFYSKGESIRREEEFAAFGHRAALEDARITFYKDFENTVGNGEPFDEKKTAILLAKNKAAYEMGIINAQELMRQNEQVGIARKNWIFDSTFEEMINAAGPEYDQAKGISIADKKAQEGLLTHDDARKLANSLNDYINNRIKAENQTKEEEDRKAVSFLRDNIDKITAADIERLKTTQDTKDIMLLIMSNRNAPKSDKSNHADYFLSLSEALGFGSGDMTETNATLGIMNRYYNNKTLNSRDFYALIHLIKKPFKPVESRAIMDVIMEFHNNRPIPGWFKSTEEANLRVADKRFLEWLDSQRTAFPTYEQMLQKYDDFLNGRQTIIQAAKESHSSNWIPAINPNGVVVEIPEVQKEDAIREGYTILGGKNAY